MEFNKYQTELTDELLKSLPKEVQEDLLDALNNIIYIQRLVSPDRPYAKDLQRDSKGRIIVDICTPHILEDMDYFRPVAIHYEKYGVLNNLMPNSNPNSEYGKWLRTELDRLWNGMVRESDGEWVTGDMYFYLNYCPIIQSRVRKGTKQADRIVAMPEVWEGIYFRFHYLEQARNGGMYDDWVGGKHAAEIAKRGCSKSYCMAAMLTKLFICGENQESYKNVRGLIIAYQKEFLNKDGTLNKFVDMIDFNAQNTEFPSRRIKDSLNEMSWKMGYKDLDTGTNKGSGNEVIGVSAKDDIDKIRGKRANKIFIEEYGNFPKIVEMYRILLPSVQEGDISFGMMYLAGTGGSENADFAGALEMMYNPRGYNLYALPNVFDKNSQGKQQTIFFYGAYLNRKGCYDHNGVSDVIKALIELFYNQYIIKYNSTDPTAITRTKAENPITIQDAIMRRDSTIFPVAYLNDRIGQIIENKQIYADIWTGEFLLKDGVVEFKPTPDIKVIREFPHRDNKLEGAVEIYHMPEKDSNGKVFSHRYYAGIDPYDDDASSTLSLGSMFILDLWTDEIVLEYTGRPLFADDFYEVCRRSLLFYNALANYENNKKGLFGYFSKMNSLYLLTDVLEFLRDKNMVKGELYGNKIKGTIASQPINAYARRCIRDWLLKPKEIVISNNNGEEIVETVPSLFTIKSKALLQELAMWNNDGNFDRVSSLGMLMLLREDVLISLGDTAPENNVFDDKDYLGNDPFFFSDTQKGGNKIATLGVEDGDLIGWGYK